MTDEHQTYQIKVSQLAEVFGRRPDEKWIADCGDNHAFGATPGEAVDRLVAFIGGRVAGGEIEMNSHGIPTRKKSTAP